MSRIDETAGRVTLIHRDAAGRIVGRIVSRVPPGVDPALWAARRVEIANLMLHETAGTESGNWESI